MFGESLVGLGSPYFQHQDADLVNVTTQLGATTYLHCRVNKLGGKIVSKMEYEDKTKAKTKIFLKKVEESIFKYRKLQPQGNSFVEQQKSLVFKYWLQTIKKSSWIKSSNYVNIRGLISASNSLERIP